MKNTQFDYKVRVVSLRNLKAMCRRLSGVCHRYHVNKVTASRVHVEYSNPNEYGNEEPIIATFPVYPNVFEKENPTIVLSEILSIIHDTEDGHGEQCFDSLITAPRLYHNREGKWEVSVCHTENMSSN